MYNEIKHSNNNGANKNQTQRTEPNLQTILRLDEEARHQGGYTKFVYSCDNVDRNGHNNDSVLQANILQPGDQRIQHTYEHRYSPHPSAAENTKTDPRRDGRSSTKQSAFFESDTDTGLIGAGIDKNKAVAADFVLREDRKRRWVSHAESIGNNINNALAAERGIFHMDNDLGETQDLQIYWASNEGYSDTSTNDDPNDEEHTTKKLLSHGRKWK